MTKFTLRVLFAAPSPKDAEDLYMNLFEQGLAEAFAVPMSGSSYTLWIRVDEEDPKDAFALAVDRLRAAAGFDLDIISLEMYAGGDPHQMPPAATETEAVV